MPEEEKDWAHPEVQRWTDLYAALHDAKLNSVQVDTLARTFLLDLALGFPQDSPSPLKGATIFFLGFSHFHAYRWHHWPGPKPDYHASVSPTEYQRILSENIAKGSVQTASFMEFAELLCQDTFHVQEARGSFLPDSSVIELEGVFDSGPCARIQIAGKSFELRVEGELTSMEALVQTAHAGWKSL